MNSLTIQIERQKKINASPPLFIKHRGLTQYQIKEKPAPADLPNDLYLGSVFFIGPKTIIESYSWIDNNYRVSPMVNYHVPTLLNQINVHAISKTEFDSDFYTWITDAKNSELVIRDKPSEIENFAIALVNNGMTLWTLRIK